MARSYAHAADPHDHDTNEAVPIGWVGLMVPFAIIFAAVIAFGNRSPGQLVGAAMLFLIPLGILAIRKAQRRSLER
jgi:hypothetical protein